MIFKTKASLLIETTPKAIFQFFNFNKNIILAFKKFNKVAELKVQVKIHYYNLKTFH